jgi:hypothetical protein
MNKRTATDLQSEPLYPEFLKQAHLDMVVSIDLKGATTMKMRLGDVKAPWILQITDFYRDFPRYLTRAYQRAPKYARTNGFRTSARLEPFMHRGDEILFRVELSHHQQSVAHIHAVKLAIEEYNQEAKKCNRLECKGTAWLCGFPVTDFEAGIPQGEGKNASIVRHYLGPSMDTGFRLAKVARPRKIVVCCGLAIMLVDALEAIRFHDTRLYMFYDGKQSLKGVLGEMPYPIIWVSVHDNSLSAHDQLKGYKREPCDFFALREFCLEFQRESGLDPWFIKSERGTRYEGPDSIWFQKFLALQEQLRKRK